MMFRVVQFLMMWSMDLVFPFVLSVVLFLMYGDLKLSAIVLFSTLLSCKIVSSKRYESFMMEGSSFVVLGVSIFLTCHYLTGALFWVAFVLLIILTIVDSAYLFMLRSINIQ